MFTEVRSNEIKETRFYLFFLNISKHSNQMELDTIIEPSNSTVPSLIELSHGTILSLIIIYRGT